jgi:hypothetical protein
MFSGLFAAAYQIEQGEQQDDTHRRKSAELQPALQAECRIGSGLSC